MKLLVIVALVFCTAVSQGAHAETPTFDCKISDGGQSDHIYGSNPSAQNFTCNVRCDMHQTDGRLVIERCVNALLLHGEVNKLLCGTPKPDWTLHLEAVDGVAHDCKQF